jgi:uncharacterized protein (DUF1697 family)
MADLRKQLLELGLADVQTYIQSVNLVFRYLEEKLNKEAATRNWRTVNILHKMTKDL